MPRERKSKKRENEMKQGETRRVWVYDDNVHLMMVSVTIANLVRTFNSFYHLNSKPIKKDFL